MLVLGLCLVIELLPETNRRSSAQLLWMFVTLVLLRNAGLILGASIRSLLRGKNPQHLMYSPMSLSLPSSMTRQNPIQISHAPINALYSFKEFTTLTLQRAEKLRRYLQATITSHGFCSDSSCL